MQSGLYIETENYDAAILDMEKALDLGLPPELVPMA
jgi:hypothetical protein